MEIFRYPFENKFYFFLLFYFFPFSLSQRLFQLNYTLFYKQHFYQQRQTEIGKNNQHPKQHPEIELLLFEKCSLFSFTLLSKNNRYS